MESDIHQWQAVEVSLTSLINKESANEFISLKAPTTGQSAYGAYPWQAVILAPGDVYQGSGALIDHMHVLTAAHKVNDFVTNGRPLKVRVGEWDGENYNFVFHSWLII